MYANQKVRQPIAYSRLVVDELRSLDIIRPITKAEISKQAGKWKKYCEAYSLVPICIYVSLGN